MSRFSLNRRWLFVLGATVLILITFGWWYVRHGGSSPTAAQLDNYISAPSSRAALITDLSQPCPGAPFRLPSTGFVGFLFANSTAPNSMLSPHTGVDIFGNGAPGTVPVYAAYDGYLTRLPEWKSAVIIRIPIDPLKPSRQIWTYYTHMASLSGDSYISRDFPPGTSEKFVVQGTLLGYQGLYVAPGDAPIAMHVHFSVVLSDASGSFLNETRFQNVLDPSPYLGLNLNATTNPTIPVRCGV